MTVKFYRWANDLRGKLILQSDGVGEAQWEGRLSVELLDEYFAKHVNPAAIDAFFASNPLIDRLTKPGKVSGGTRIQKPLHYDQPKP